MECEKTNGNGLNKMVKNENKQMSIDYSWKLLRTDSENGLFE